MKIAATFFVVIFAVTNTLKRVENKCRLLLQF